VSWRSTNAYALRRAAILLCRRPLLALATALYVATSLALVLSVALLWLGLAPALNRLPANPEISIFVAHGTGDQELKALKGRIELTAGVATVRTVSKDSALADVLRRTPPGFPQAELKRNPLPDVLIATLAIDAPSAVVEAATANIRKMRPVNAVYVDLDWHRTLRSNLSVGSKVAVVLAFGGLLVVVGSMAVAVRVHVRASATESELLELVGASRGFVRRPFLFVGGALLGVAGALAVSGVWVGWIWLAPELETLEAVPTATGGGFPIGSEVLGAIWVGCCALGVLIAWASSHRQHD